MADTELQLLQGTIDVLILKALSWAPMHGYGVSRVIKRHSAEALAVEDAALYQALHRLERRGLVASEWGLSENNRRAKYYRLTATGRRELRREVETWRRYVVAVSAVLDAASLEPAGGAHG